MKYLRKRLGVVNDGFCKSKVPANVRIHAVINRYVAKMSEKGWIPYVAPSSGNAFAQYEAYVHLCKPVNKSERTEMLSRAKDHGWDIINLKWGN